MMVKTRQIQRTCQIIAATAVLQLLAPAVQAQQGATGKSFVENFDKLNTSFWYISDGWSNGSHQNCTWSKNQVRVEDGMLRLGFTEGKTGDRNYACGEIQTRARFGYGTYEVRMKAATGSGLNSAFFSFIGPMDKKPHDEIDFEVLGKNTGEIQVNQYINGKGGNEKLVPVAGGADQNFNDYAFIWEESRLRYFVNGKLVHEVTDKSKIPTNAQKIFASLWGTEKLTQWMGRFSYSQPASMLIDRIAFTAPGENCQFPGSVLCTAD